MSESNNRKRSKAFYRKSAHGGKKQCTGGGNRLEPGQHGFLVMCNNNESSAVRETYNILNDYADQIFGQGLSGPKTDGPTAEIGDGGNEAAGVEPLNQSASEEEEEDDCDDMEKALKKEVASMKSQPNEQRRFQNCATKAKNCVFIRTTVEDPVDLAVRIMEDIAEKKISRARFAARILPIVGTCKAHTPDIQELANKTLRPVFSPENPKVPKSFTVLFKARNNNTTTCGKLSVIPAVTNVVKEINPSVEFSWNDFDVAILVEIVCTVCCLGVAPSFNRLRKYNLQELLQGPKELALTKVPNIEDASAEERKEMNVEDSANSCSDGPLNVDSSAILNCVDENRLTMGVAQKEVREGSNNEVSAEQDTGKDQPLNGNSNGKCETDFVESISEQEKGLNDVGGDNLDGSISEGKQDEPRVGS